MDWVSILPEDGGSWDIGLLSANPNLPFELVLARPAIKWVWKSFSANPTLPFAYAMAHPEVDWDWEKVLMNSVLTLQEVLSYSKVMYSNTIWNSFLLWHQDGSILGDLLGWKRIWFGYITANRAIPLAAIWGRQDLIWDKKYLSSNPNLTISWLRKPPVSIPGKWDWAAISKNSAFPLAVQLEHPDLPWDLRTRCLNPSLDEEEILSHPELPWEPEFLQLNPALSMQFLRQHVIRQPHDCSILCQNSGRELGELFDLYRNQGRPSNFPWSFVTRYGGFPSRLRAFQLHLTDSGSYFSLLPRDMALTYFSLYLAPIPVSFHGDFPGAIPFRDFAIQL